MNTVPASRLIVSYISSHIKADTVIIPIFQLEKLRLTLGAKSLAQWNRATKG